MTLFTKAIETKLIDNHNKHKTAWNDEHPTNIDSKVVCKLFNPTGLGTWYLTEYNPETKTAFGLAVLHEKEFGYIDIPELLEFKGLMGLGIERDLYFPMNKKTLEECRKEK